MLRALNQYLNNRVFNINYELLPELPPKIKHLKSSKKVVFALRDILADSRVPISLWQEQIEYHISLQMSLSIFWKIKIINKMYYTLFTTYQ